MAKVRWSQKCAGGCGTYLTSGSVATRLYNGWFCAACVKRHGLQSRIAARQRV